MNKQLLDELITKAQEFIENKDKKGLKGLLNCLDKMYYQPSFEGGVPDEIYDQIVDLYDTAFSKDKLYHQLKGVGAKGKISIDTRKDIILPYHMGTILKFSAMMIDKNNSEWRTRPVDYAKKFKAWKIKYPKGPYTIEGKADGISCLLIYEKDGNTIKRTIYSRGTGNTGKDLSRYIKHNDSGFNMIPSGENFDDGKIVIRGELVMRYKIWKKKYSKDFSNPRNIVGGFVTKKKNDNVNPSDIDFVAYEQILPRDKTRYEQIEELQRLGFMTVMTKQVESLSEPELFKILKEFRKNSPYEIDGLVVFDDSIVHPVSKVEVLPSAFAYKVNTQTAIVDVVGIEWSSSTTNALKPVVVYKPVTIGRLMPDGKVVGAVYHRATAFNAGFVKKHKIGPGAKLLIVRSGDVIPHIEEVLKQAKNADLPDTVRDGNKNYNYKGHNKIEFIWGEGTNRRSKLDIFAVEILNSSKIKQMTLFFSGGRTKRGMNIKGVAKETLKKLFENGYTSITAVLQTSAQDLENIGFGKIQSKNIRNEIENILFNHPVDLAQLMGATQVFPHARTRTVKKILEKYPNILTNKKYYGSNPDKLENVTGVGQETLDAFIKALPIFTLFLADNPQITVFTTKNIDPISNKLKNKSFVFTGTMDKMKRIEAQELVVKNGGNTSNTIKKSTDFLVIGDKGGGGKKQELAENLGVKIISESVFLKMV